MAVALVLRGVSQEFLARRFLRRLKVVNLCCSCRADFASTAAFDRHRVGRHAYLFAEGLSLVPPREDGRRCLDGDEMAGVGMVLDVRGRWAIEADHARIAAWKVAA